MIEEIAMETINQSTNGDRRENTLYLRIVEKNIRSDD